MSNWCKYCVDRSSWCSTDYKCIKSGKEETIPDGYVKWYCGDENVAYSRCPLYNRWYITTMTSNILKIDNQNPTITNLKKVKEVLQKNKNFMEAYDSVGFIIANKMLYSNDREEKASKVFSRLEKISSLVDNNQMDLATKRYIMMTLRLVVEYNLQDLYKSKKKKILENK